MTDFTYIAGFIYFVNIVYNTVAVVVVVIVVDVEVVMVKVVEVAATAVVIVVVVLVVVAVTVVRNVCYNGYLPQVMLCLFFWNMDHEKESGRKCWMCKSSKPISVGKLVPYRYDPWDCKNVHKCIVPQ